MLTCTRVNALFKEVRGRAHTAVLLAASSSGSKSDLHAADGSTQLGHAKACCPYHICSLASLHGACSAASALPLWVSASQWCQQSLCGDCLQDNRRLAKQFSSGHNEYGYGNQEETLASRRDSATRSAHRDQVRTVGVHSFAKCSVLTPRKCTACLSKHCPVICAAADVQPRSVHCTLHMFGRASAPCSRRAWSDGPCTTTEGTVHPQSCPQVRSVLDMACRPVQTLAPPEGPSLGVHGNHAEPGTRQTVSVCCWRC